MRNRQGRLEAFDTLLEELANPVLASRATAPSASDSRPEALYAGARMTRDFNPDARMMRDSHAGATARPSELAD